MTAFEEFKKHIQDECLDEEEKLDFILSALLNANRISEKIERLPVFTGTYTNIPMGILGKKIIDVHTIWGEEIKDNPFKDDDFYTVARSRNNVGSGDKIVFIAERGNLNTEKELLYASDYYTFKELDLSENPEPEKLLNEIIERPRFFKYQARIADYLNYHAALEGKKSELEKIEEKIANLNTEFEKKKGEFEKYKKEIEPIIPYGITALENSVKKLLDERLTVQKGIDELKAKKQKILIREETIKQQLEELNNLTPAGKTVDDVLVALNEYKENKIEIEKAKVLREWLIGKYVPEKEEYPLSTEQMQSLNYIEERLPYKYSENILVPTLSALSTNQLIVLFGKPGTGKTSYVRFLSKALGAKYTIVPVQNNWMDKADILGYFNPMNNTYTSTVFLEALINAQQEFIAKGNESRLHIICLDEMNLGRIEYYFAEFLSLMQVGEEEQILHVLPKYIEDAIMALQNKQKSFTDEETKILNLRKYLKVQIPRNVRFIGTMNNDDTTNNLSPKVRDRSFFIEMTNDGYKAANPIRNLDDYYPLSFFEVEDFFRDECLDVFENEKENGRFMNYMQQMYAFYKAKLKMEDVDTFVSYLIISKILPTIHDVNRFTGSGYNSDRYPLALDKFKEHLSDKNTTYFDFLGV